MSESIREAYRLARHYIKRYYGKVNRLYGLSKPGAVTVNHLGKIKFLSPWTGTSGHCSEHDYVSKVYHRDGSETLGFWMWYPWDMGITFSTHLSMMDLKDPNGWRLGAAGQWLWTRRKEYGPLWLTQPNTPPMISPSHGGMVPIRQGIRTIGLNASKRCWELPKQVLYCGENGRMVLPHCACQLFILIVS